MNEQDKKAVKDILFTLALGLFLTFAGIASFFKYYSLTEANVSIITLIGFLLFSGGLLFGMTIIYIMYLFDDEK